MSVINFTQVGVGVDGWGQSTSGFVAQNLTAAFNTSLQQIQALGFNRDVGSLPNGPIKGTCGISYFITGADPFYAMYGFGKTGDLTTPIVISVNNLRLTGCYMTTLAVRGAVNQIVEGNASFNVYMDEGFAEGALAAKAADTSTLDLAVGHGTYSTVVGITDAVSFDYNGTLEFQEIYKIGDAAPITPLPKVRSQETITLQGHDISNNVTLCGVAATGTVTVKDLCNASTLQVYTVAGKVSSRDLNVSVGNAVAGSITIISTN